MNDQSFDLIEIKRPVGQNYLILESLNQMKDNNNYKSIHVIILEEDKKIIIGRGHDSDVRINDISVSRAHAYLQFSKGRLLLKDLKSKFGTLGLIRNEVEVGNQKVCLQVGRTYIEANKIDRHDKDFSKFLKIKNTGGHFNKLGAYESLSKIEKQQINEIPDDQVRDLILRTNQQLNLQTKENDEAKEKKDSDENK